MDKYLYACKQPKLNKEDIQSYYMQLLELSLNFTGFLPIDDAFGLRKTFILAHNVLL
jgi:hypothetical protein